jgi:hypothetical protein
MKTLTQEQTLAVLTYLFSVNGIMSQTPNVKQLAAQLFLSWYKERKQGGDTLPYVEHFLDKLAPTIIQRISTQNIA